MAKLLRTNGTGSAQTTAETQDSKEKVYTDLATAEADIANIAENEFIDTLDEEVVKEGDIVTKEWLENDYHSYVLPTGSGIATGTVTATKHGRIVFLSWTALTTTSAMNTGGNRVLVASLPSYLKPAFVAGAPVDGVNVNAKVSVRDTSSGYDVILWNIGASASNFDAGTVTYLAVNADYE